MVRFGAFKDRLARECDKITARCLAWRASAAVAGGALGRLDRFES